MSRKLKIILGASAVAIIAIGGFLFFVLHSSRVNQDSASDHEIRFSKSLFLNDHSIAIDGGPEMDVPCAGDFKNPASFGFLNGGKEGKLQLTCVEGYMGGISLSYVDAEGTARDIDLAQTEEDAGDTWDTRTWLSRDADQNLLVRMVTLTSSQDSLTGTIQDCSMKKLFYYWDPKAQMLVEDSATIAFDVPLFPDSPVASGCFDDRGNWTGL